LYSAQIQARSSRRRISYYLNRH